MRVPQIIMGFGVVVLVLLFLSPARHVPAYNAAAEVTLHGVVQEVSNFYCPISGSVGTHLMLRTDNKVVEVHVAPSRFLTGKNLQFLRGDQIEVTGTAILFRSHEGLIARTISRGTQTVALRNENGKPQWER